LEGLQEEQELLDLVIGESIEEGIETSARANVVGVAGFGDRVASTDGVWRGKWKSDEVQYVVSGNVEVISDLEAVFIGGCVFPSGPATHGDV